MNSMFSSFDAVCAELLGKTVNPAAASSSSFFFSVDQQKKQPKVSSPRGRSFFLKKETPTPISDQKDAGKQEGPGRFAVELDGLNCFETIVSY